MSYLLAANNAISTLAGAITNTATMANLAAGSGVLFPSPSGNQYFCLTFIDAATGLLREIVHVTGVSTDTITIVRGQEGTTALNWNAGDLAQNLWTAGSMQALQQPGQFYAVDTGVANSIVVTLAPAPTSWSQLIGIPMLVKVGSGNTNTATSVVINPNGLGNKTVVLPSYAVPPIGSLAAGSIVELTYDGTDVQVTAGATHPFGVTEWTQTAHGSGTFTVPAGVYSLFVEGVGAGAGGSGANSDQSGGAGGAGGYFRGVMAVTPGQAISWAVGQGSAGVAQGSTATQGGTTTFGTFSSTGGFGGESGSSVAGGGGGIGSGATLNLQGGDGGDGNITAANVSGAIGGASYYGGGGRMGSGGGTDGVVPGSGGGGAYNGSGNGGAGADGAIYVRY